MIFQNPLKVKNVKKVKNDAQKVNSYALLGKKHSVLLEHTVLLGQLDTAKGHIY